MDSKVFKNIPLDPNRSLFDTIPNVPTTFSNPAYKGKQQIWPGKHDSLIDQISRIWDLSSEQPNTKTWAISHHNKINCVLNSFSGLYIVTLFQKKLKIQSR